MAAQAYPLLATDTEASWSCKHCTRFGSMLWSQTRMQVCLCGAPAPMEQKRAEKLKNQKRAEMVQGMSMSTNRMFELNLRMMRSKKRRTGSYAPADDEGGSRGEEDVDLDETDEALPSQLRLAQYKASHVKLMDSYISLLTLGHQGILRPHARAALKRETIATVFCLLPRRAPDEAQVIHACGIDARCRCLPHPCAVLMRMAACVCDANACTRR